jgi:starch synthase
MTKVGKLKFYGILMRRHQLHEVIRLSGMNLVVNDLDMPLIIKVASIPKERIQVYFIDNDEYFKRKATFADEERESCTMMSVLFSLQGVVETVKIELGSRYHSCAWLDGSYVTNIHEALL